MRRWHRIKEYLHNANTPSKNTSSSLSELEKYVFKRTYTAQAPAPRLNRLETKLFGKPNPSMPTAYRVARLERTLGLEASPEGMAQLPPRFIPPSGIGTPGMEMPLRKFLVLVMAWGIRTLPNSNHKCRRCCNKCKRCNGRSHLVLTKVPIKALAMKSTVSICTVLQMVVLKSDRSQILISITNQNNHPKTKSLDKKQCPHRR